MKIGLDVDGVLADFIHGYNALVRQELGIDLPYPAPTWNWHTDGGVTPEQDTAMWEIIKATPFQGTLQPLKGAPDALERLNALSLKGNDIYFITNRSGSLAKFWTEMWLRFHGMSAPTVLIAKDKGPVVKGMELDVFVDDLPTNTQAVLDAVGRDPRVRVYLPRHPYNEWAWSQPFNYGQPVADLNEVLEIEFGRKE
jgi:hypothetical protein